MLYVALTWWLLVIVFSAWGVHWLWSRMVRPRVINTVLLPGTLVAQLGHVLGLLVTGNSVRNTTLMGDDEDGGPKSDTPAEQRIPIIGPILTGLLPLVACGGGLYLVSRWWGGSVLSGLSKSGGVGMSQTMPMSLHAMWQMLRDSITNTENMLDAILHSDLTNWTTILFLYLAVCLTVRMTPFEGNRRGAIGAIALAGLTVGLISLLAGGVERFVQTSWPILSFATGMLLFLLLTTLLISGVVGLVRILAKNE